MSNFPYFNSSETCPVDVDRTFDAAADYSTYNDSCACMDLTLSYNIPSGDFVDVLYLGIHGAYGVASGGTLYGLWIDSDCTGTKSGTFYPLRISIQAGGLVPTGYMHFQCASPGAAYLFTVAGTVSPVYGNAGTYSTADGYLAININGTAYRIPYFAAVD
jgi:hypothetical protein